MNIACFISISVGTSVGTIVALTPVAAGIAMKAGAPEALMLGVVVGGAMFGDNLSFISDTTIVATRTQGCNMDEMMKALDNNFKGSEMMRQTILNRTPFFGNDDPYADAIAVKVYNDLYDAIEGKPNTKGECFHLNMAEVFILGLFCSARAIASSSVTFVGSGCATSCA